MSSYEIGEVPLSKIIVDPRVQRTQVSHAQINRMVENFDAGALGTIIVSLRKGGKYVVLDGWHRVTVCSLVEDGPEMLDAIIWTGLTLEEEARKFLRHNDKTAVNAVDKLNARVHAGDEEALRIDEILKEFGLTIGLGSFDAIATTLRIVRRPNGFKHFYDALTIIDDAWTLGADTSDGRIIEGIAIMLSHHENLDKKGFAKRLSGHNGGEAPMADLLQKMTSYHRTANPGRFAISAVTVLIGVYNRGRRVEGRLAPWLGDRRLRKSAVAQIETDIEETEETD